MAKTLRCFGRLLLAASLCLTRPVQALVILQYHHISNETPAATSTSPERFAAHLALIDEAGYRVLDLGTVIDLVRSGTPLPDKTVLITFDDSYASIYETAYPLLREKEWPFVVFANTESVDLGLRGFLSWNQLRMMAAGGAAIANHSVSHSHMVRRDLSEKDTAWRQRISAEILDAERRIEAEIGHNYRVLAFPYGEFSAELETLLHSLGFLGMAQHSGGATSAQALALPRFAFGGPYGDPEDFALRLGNR